MSPLALAFLAEGSHWLAQLISQLLGFILLVLVILWFVKPVLAKVLGERTKGVEDTFRQIEEETAKTSRELADVRRRLAEVQQESERRHRQAMADAEKIRAQSLAEGAQQAEALVEKARREIGIERDKAVQELREEAEDLTLEAADHLVQATMNDALQQKMVDNYLGKIDSTDRT